MSTINIMQTGSFSMATFVSNHVNNSTRPTYALRSRRNAPRGRKRVTGSDHSPLPPRRHLTMLEDTCPLLCGGRRTAPSQGPRRCPVRWGPSRTLKPGRAPALSRDATGSNTIGLSPGSGLPPCGKRPVMLRANARGTRPARSTTPEKAGYQPSTLRPPKPSSHVIDARGDFRQETYVSATSPNVVQAPSQE